MILARLVRSERGQVAGIEVLPFGLLIFVAGTLLLANIWGVVDARFAADAASREAARWVVERAGTTTADQLRAGATEVATQTMRDHGRTRAPEVVIGPEGVSFRRCERITVTVRTAVPALRLPFIGGYGTAFDIVATHSELVDPTRAGVAGTADCLS